MTAEKTTLKTSPYWWEAAPVVPLPQKALTREVDVAIVGAGYAGLTAGMTLARAGRSVAIFDRQHPGEGASSRNGGITSGNIRLDRPTLVKKFGEDRADAISLESKDARQHLYDLMANEGIECDFKLVGRFGGALGTEDYDRMARQAEYLERTLGIESYAVPQSEQHRYIGSDYFRGGNVRMDIGGLHPAKFISELLRVTLEAGVTVHSDTGVERIEEEEKGFTLHTDRGTVKAKKVLVCTNGYTDRATPWLQRRIVPVRSRIIATEPLPPELMKQLMPRSMMLNDTRTLGFYFRPSPDGTRILFGGRDGTTLEDPTKPVAYLRKNLLDIFPELAPYGISHTWYGKVAMHRDMIPRIFEQKGVMYATGFCGSGVVWAPWIGRKAAQKLLGNTNEAPSAFDFKPPAPIPFYNGTPWFMPFFMMKYRRDDVLKMRRAGRK